MLRYHSSFALLLTVFASLPLNVVARADDFLVTCYNVEGNNKHNFAKFSVYKLKSCQEENSSVVLPNENPIDTSITNRFLSKGQRIFDVTWSHKFLNVSNVDGYLLKFTAQNSVKSECFKAEFIKQFNILGRQTFMLQCSTLDGSAEVQLSLTPSTKSGVRIKRGIDLCPFLKNLTFDVAYNRNKSLLRVHIKNYNSHPDYQEYKVVLVEGSTKAECNEGSRQALFRYFLPKHRKNIFIYQLYLAKKYCIKLEPTKCDSFGYSEAFNFESNDTIDNLDCFTSEKIDDWNAFIAAPRTQRNDRSITVIFSTKNSTQQGCYTINKYTVQIKKVSSMNGCDGTLTNSTDVENNTSQEVTFYNLTPGSYCAMIIPVSDFCKPGSCPERYSVVSKLESPSETSGDVKPGGSSTTSSTPTIVIAVIISGVVIFSIILTAYFTRRRCTKKRRGFSSEHLVDLHPKLRDVMKSVAKRPKVKVLLTYYVKNPLMRSSVENIIEVLTSRLHCEVIVNNYSTACKHSDSLGMNYLDWSQHQMKVVDFVLIMASEFDIDAVQNAPFENEDHSMYAFCIETIKINSRLHWSDKNVCVFRFDNCPLHQILLDVVPTTWCLPQQLGNFFNHLHKESVQEREFQEYYKTDHVVQKFRNAVTTINSHSACAYYNSGQ